MDNRIKKLWVNALRSGEYKQGKMRMRKEDRARNDVRYCCLGVLTEVQCQETDAEFTHDKQLLSTNTRDWAGLEQRDPSFVRNGETETLATMNDRGDSFAQIADDIERYL